MKKTDSASGQFETSLEVAISEINRGFSNGSFEKPEELARIQKQISTWDLAARAIGERVNQQQRQVALLDQGVRPLYGVACYDNDHNTYKVFAFTCKAAALHARDELKSQRTPLAITTTFCEWTAVMPDIVSSRPLLMIDNESNADLFYSESEYSYFGVLAFHIDENKYSIVIFDRINRATDFLQKTQSMSPEANLDLFQNRDFVGTLSNVKLDALPRAYERLNLGLLNYGEPISLRY